MEEIDDTELVLITGENLEHVWINGNCTSDTIQEITIQFHGDLFSNVLMKNQFRTIREMFEKAAHGLAFPVQTARKIKPLLLGLGSAEDGFHSYIRLLELMHELSLVKTARILSSTAFSNPEEECDSRRVKKVLGYLQDHYREPIRLSDVAELVNMSEVSFSRFIKKRTGRTFVEYLNGIRLGFAARMLVDSTLPVCDICFACGFYNLSNFNRIFKKRKGVTPSEFREQYAKTKILI